MDGSSWFGSNLTLRLHLREISQLMESYPQLIPNITKVVEPLKAYKWRHSHGEQGGENNQQSIVILIVDLSSKGLDEEDLERLLQHHLNIVSVSLKFSSIYLAYFLLVCVYMYLSMLVLIFHR
jgi:hypothetical protein